ncbi:MAG: peptidylprolyl isomerase [Clostridia bacterium]|nr:peptidylprolyl isomerase [Clostridia bacterium]
MKKIICLATALILLCFSFASCEKGPVAYEDIDFSKITDISKVSVSDTETDYVIMDVKDYGTIVIRLYPDVAPETVANFKKLVSQKFYDGIIFHRVIENFMIQGGDPDGDGTGGSAETIKGEFSSNGFENNLKHDRGVVSMARLGYDNDSASSQFFIMHVDYPYLNGDYASFGYVVYGMDVVDAIAVVPTNSNDKPLTDVVINSIKFANVEE